MKYYDVEDVVKIVLNGSDEVQEILKTPVKRTVEERHVRVEITWTELYGYGRYLKTSRCKFEGEAVIRGNWIYFQCDIKKKMSCAQSGKFVS